MLYYCVRCVKCEGCGSPNVSEWINVTDVKGIPPDSPSSQMETKMMPFCSRCLKLQKTNNFCPVCLGCYEDDDFELKMMECGRCKEWIHSHCEGLSDEFYQILSILPDSIEYICRLCRDDNSSEWNEAVKKELKRGLNSVLNSLINSKCAKNIIRIENLVMNRVNKNNFAFNEDIEKCEDSQFNKDTSKDLMDNTLVQSLPNIENIDTIQERVNDLANYLDSDNLNEECNSEINLNLNNYSILPIENPVSQSVEKSANENLSAPLLPTLNITDKKKNNFDEQHNDCTQSLPSFFEDTFQTSKQQPTLPNRVQISSENPITKSNNENSIINYALPVNMSSYDTTEIDSEQIENIENEKLSLTTVGNKNGTDTPNIDIAQTDFLQNSLCTFANDANTEALQNMPINNVDIRSDISEPTSSNTQITYDENDTPLITCNDVNNVLQSTNSSIIYESQVNRNDKKNDCSFEPNILKPSDSDCNRHENVLRVEINKDNDPGISQDIVENCSIETDINNSDESKVAAEESTTVSKVTTVGEKYNENISTENTCIKKDNLKNINNSINVKYSDKECQQKYGKSKSKIANYVSSENILNICKDKNVINKSSRRLTRSVLTFIKKNNVDDMKLKHCSVKLVDILHSNKNSNILMGDKSCSVKLIDNIYELTELNKDGLKCVEPKENCVQKNNNTEFKLQLNTDEIYEQMALDAEDNCEIISTFNNADNEIEKQAKVSSDLSLERTLDPQVNTEINHFKTNGSQEVLDNEESAFKFGITTGSQEVLDNKESILNFEITTGSQEVPDTAVSVSKFGINTDENKNDEQLRINPNIVNDEKNDLIFKNHVELNHYNETNLDIINNTLDETDVLQYQSSPPEKNNTHVVKDNSMMTVHCDNISIVNNINCDCRVMASVLPKENTSQLLNNSINNVDSIKDISNNADSNYMTTYISKFDNNADNSSMTNVSQIKNCTDITNVSQLNSENNNVFDIGNNSQATTSILDNITDVLQLENNTSIDNNNEKSILQTINEMVVTNSDSQSILQKVDLVENNFLNKEDQLTTLQLEDNAIVEMALSMDSQIILDISSGKENLDTSIQNESSVLDNELENNFSNTLDIYKDCTHETSHALDDDTCHTNSGKEDSLNCITDNKTERNNLDHVPFVTRVCKDIDDDCLSSEESSFCSSDTEIESIFDDHSDPRDLQDIKDKLWNDRYTSMIQFHIDVMRVLEAGKTLSNFSIKNCREIYKTIMKETFPWFEFNKIDIFSLIDSTMPFPYPSYDHNYTDVKSKDRAYSSLSCRRSALGKSSNKSKGKTSPIKALTKINDTRKCILCNVNGDCDPQECGRLLYLGQDEWLHVNCCLWSSEVYEEEDGGLQNVYVATSRGRQIKCSLCCERGATIGCCHKSCQATFHFQCAKKSHCFFGQDKRIFCNLHVSSADGQIPIDDLRVRRCVFVNMDSEKKKWKQAFSNKLNVVIGSLVIKSLGKMFPDLDNYDDALIPVEFICTRMFWSVKNPNNRVKYTCRTKRINPYQDLADGNKNFGFHKTIDHNELPDIVEKEIKIVDEWHKEIDRQKWEKQSMETNIIPPHMCPLYRSLLMEERRREKRDVASKTLSARRKLFTEDEEVKLNLNNIIKQISHQQEVFTDIELTGDSGSGLITNIVSANDNEIISMVLRDLSLAEYSTALSPHSSGRVSPLDLNFLSSCDHSLPPQELNDNNTTVVSSYDLMPVSTANKDTVYGDHSHKDSFCETISNEENLNVVNSTQFADHIDSLSCNDQLATNVNYLPDSKDQGQEANCESLPSTSTLNNNYELINNFNGKNLKDNILPSSNDFPESSNVNNCDSSNESNLSKIVNKLMELEEKIDSKQVVKDFVDETEGAVMSNSSNSASTRQSPFSAPLPSSSGSSTPCSSSSKKQVCRVLPMPATGSRRTSSASEQSDTGTTSIKSLCPPSFSPTETNNSATTSEKKKIRMNRNSWTVIKKYPLRSSSRSKRTSFKTVQIEINETIEIPSEEDDDDQIKISTGSKRKWSNTVTNNNSKNLLHHQGKDLNLPSSSKKIKKTNHKSKRTEQTDDKSKNDLSVKFSDDHNDITVSIVNNNNLCNFTKRNKPQRYRHKTLLQLDGAADQSSEESGESEHDSSIQCSISQPFKSNLALHIKQQSLAKSSPGEEGPYKCFKCKRLYRTKDSCSRHIETCTFEIDSSSATSDEESERNSDQADVSSCIIETSSKAEKIQSLSPVSTNEIIVQHNNSYIHLKDNDNGNKSEVIIKGSSNIEKLEELCSSSLVKNVENERTSESIRNQSIHRQVRISMKKGSDRVNLNPTTESVSTPESFCNNSNEVFVPPNKSPIKFNTSFKKTGSPRKYTNIRLYKGKQGYQYRRAIPQMQQETNVLNLQHQQPQQQTIQQTTLPITIQPMVNQNTYQVQGPYAQPFQQTSVNPFVTVNNEIGVQNPMAPIGQVVTVMSGPSVAIPQGYALQYVGSYRDGGIGTSSTGLLTYNTPQPIMVPPLVMAPQAAPMVMPQVVNTNIAYAIAAAPETLVINQPAPVVQNVQYVAQPQQLVQPVSNNLMTFNPSPITQVAPQVQPELSSHSVTNNGITLPQQLLQAPGLHQPLIQTCSQTTSATSCIVQPLQPLVSQPLSFRPQALVTPITSKSDISTPLIYKNNGNSPSRPLFPQLPAISRSVATVAPAVFTTSSSTTSKVNITDPSSQDSTSCQTSTIDFEELPYSFSSVRPRPTYSYRDAMGDDKQDKKRLKMEEMVEKTDYLSSIRRRISTEDDTDSLDEKEEATKKQEDKNKTETQSFKLILKKDHQTGDKFNIQPIDIPDIAIPSPEVKELRIKAKVSVGPKRKKTGDSGQRHWEQYGKDYIVGSLDPTNELGVNEQQPNMSLNFSPNGATTQDDSSLIDKPKAITPEPYIVFELTSEDGFKAESRHVIDVWQKVFDAVAEARENLRLKSSEAKGKGLSGLYMLGLTHNAVQYLLEQLPGAKDCHKYSFQFHRRPTEVDFIENASGCARSETFKTRSPYDIFSWLASKHRRLPNKSLIQQEEIQLSMRRATSLELPMAMRYRHLCEAAREAVGVFRSSIHGRGLFCKRDIDAGEMVIEYAGQVIRSCLCDMREKFYESKGIGCYMFRIDDEIVIDATMHGNAARFINHSCDPNCYSRVVDILGKKHIIIFALRRILRGEELTYDYKFPIEDDKIPCSCGARRCRKYLN